MNALHIVESAYRATLEEQDDTIVWLTQAMRGAGAAVDLLLRGNAVNYAVRGQDARGLELGGWTQTAPPQLEQDLARLMAKGGSVFALSDDLEQRGIDAAALIDGVRPMPMPMLPALLAGYDRVWHW